MIKFSNENLLVIESYASHLLKNPCVKCSAEIKSSCTTKCKNREEWELSEEITKFNNEFNEYERKLATEIAMKMVSVAYARRKYEESRIEMNKEDAELSRIIEAYT